MPNIISISILTGLKQTCKRSYRAHRKLGSGVERERERERVDEEKVKMRVSYYWEIYMGNGDMEGERRQGGKSMSKISTNHSIMTIHAKTVSLILNCLHSN